jgi:diguanylate cyclase (GGDEF)-like protein
MKPIIFFLLIIIFISISSDEITDSLKSILPTQTQADKISTLLLLSERIGKDEPEKALAYAKEALQIAQELKHPQNTFQSLIQVGFAYDYQQKTQKAIQYFELAREFAAERNLKKEKAQSNYYLGMMYEKTNHYTQCLDFYADALQQFEAIKDTIYAFNVLGNLANFHHLRLNYNKSLTYYLKRLEIAETLDDYEAVTESYNAVGNLFSSIGNNEKAMEFYEKALHIYLEEADSLGLSIIYNNIAIIHDDLQNKEKALEFYKKALHIEQTLGLTDGTIYNNIGDVELQNKNAEEAIRYFEIAEDYAKYEHDNVLLLIVYNNLAEAYLLQKDYSKANHYLQLCLPLLKVVPDREMEAHTYANFSRLFQEQNQLKKAFQYLQLYADLQDSVYFYKTSQELTNMQIKIELEEKEQEIELLKINEEIRELAFAKQRAQRNFIAIVLILSFLLIALFYNRYLIKKRANEQLQEANSQILSMNEKLEKIARTDPLTNLPNRRGMLEKIDYEITRFQRNQRKFSLALADIDNFKEINDTYGHDMGDFVLREMANLFELKTRKQDIVSRWGGEEFLFPETELEGAMFVAENLRKNVEEQLFSKKGLKLFVTMTFGICMFEEKLSLDSCLKKADERLYQGKKKGKNCVVCEK